MQHYDLTPEEAEVFLEETEELLQSLDEDLIQLENSSDPDLINRIFRALHTIKGAAGSINHTAMAHLAHAAENVLDQVRKNELEVHAGLIDVLLEILDALKSYQDDVVADRESTLDSQPLIDRLQEVATQPAAAEAVEASVELPDLTEAQHQQLHQAIQANQNILAIYAYADPDGAAPLARLLQLHMAMEEVGTVLVSRPSLTEIEQGEGSTTLVALLITDKERQDIHSKLGNVDELRELQVAEMTGAIDLLVQSDGPKEQSVSPSSSQSDTADPGRDASAKENLEETSPPTPNRDSPTGAQEKATKQPTPPEPKKPSGKKNKEPAQKKVTKTVRTSVERLDNLVNLAGELVTDRNRLLKVRDDLAELVDEELLGPLTDAIAHLSGITDQLQEEVMRARMQPIENVFNKFPRLVRQISKNLGKQIELVVTGQETELDRTVIEEVSDPLLHLIRNAIDHGIELPAERIANGKPPKGRLELDARSEENSIIITIRDDGKGIDDQKVRAKAVRMGLITQEQADAMSYQEAIDLIFLPGLSTASEVSDLSGRGVGMDVVRNNIERLNGSVRVFSEPGQGTTFEMRLPLTLAIVSALLVDVQDQVFALPLSSVVETIKLQPEQIQTIDRREVMRLREEVIPLLKLSRLFNIEDGIADSAESYPYVVSLRQSDTQLGLVVDRLLGKQDVVIKSLGDPLNNVRGLSGGTILGDGRIGLIVDIPALVHLAVEEHKQITRAA